MSSGQINGAEATPVSQQLPDDKALENAKETEVVRLKNGKFKVGTSKGSAFNRTVRKVFMPKTYQREALKATQRQRVAAVETLKGTPNTTTVSLSERKITVAEYRSLRNPPPPLPDAVSSSLNQQGATPAKVFTALQEASENLHKGKQFKSNQIAGGAQFGDILPPQKTAIRVTGTVKKNPGIKADVPFHANKVGHRYIATQGPRSDTASPEYKDYFYQMLANESTNTVVNLTNGNDVASSVPKSKGTPIKGGKPTLDKQYWPDKGQTAQHGENRVKTTEWERSDDFDVITLQLTKPDNATKEVKIFQFHSWPDHGIPDTDARVDAFRRFSEAVEQRGETARTTVHCRAGVGRTGVFIALDQLKKEARKGALTQDNLLERATEIVWSGRQDRGQVFVQQAKQFEFIISEMKAELNRLAEQGSTTTQETEPSDFDDENLYENTPFHGDSSVYENVTKNQRSQGYTAPAKPSTTADSIIKKLESYSTQQQLIDDIKTINSPQELENLSQKFQSYTNVSEEHKNYYRELVTLIDNLYQNL